jgi:hypothetical protein
MLTNLIERETRHRTTTDMLRVDHVSDSRHKYVSATPNVVKVKHLGDDVLVALPSHCPT